MLDKYKEDQEQVVRILNNQLSSKKISHAYLFISNNYSSTLELIKDFIVSIISFQENIDIEAIDHKIKNDSFVDITIIEPDGLFIKKNQIEQLQHDFQNTALENEKKFYIIKDVDKLNKSSANTILKFLEEPEANIIAFLITNNKNSLIETITSRCVNINLQNDTKLNQDVKSNIATILFDDKKEREEFINQEETTLKIESVLKFLNHYENNGIESIIYLNELFHKSFKEKEDVLKALDIMILFYGDVLKYQVTNKISIFIDKENIKKIALKNNNYKLSKKINTIIDAKNKVRENANIKLMMDKLIIDLEEV